MAAVFVGLMIVIASSFGFGLTLFGRPIPQPATEVPDRHPGAGGVAVAIPSPTEGVPSAEAGPDAEDAAFPTDEELLEDDFDARQRSGTGQPIRIGALVRLRSTALLVLGILVAAVVIGAALDAVVVFVGLLLQ